LAIRCSRAGSGSHLMRNRKPGTGILDMPSQSDYTQLRTSEQSTSLNDEYHQSDSINDAPFGPDLRFIDTTLKQVAFAEVYVQVAQFVSKQEKFLSVLLLGEECNPQPTTHNTFSSIHCEVRCEHHDDAFPALTSSLSPSHVISNLFIS